MVLFPLAGTIIIVCAAKQSEESKMDAKKGWTMLEFAAETGQSGVAMYLIEMGASTNNNFLKIAEMNNQRNFLSICHAAVNMRAKAITAENRLTVANQMNSLQILMHNIKFGDLSLTYEDLCESYQILIADIENEVNLNAKANMIKCLIDSLKEAIEYTHQFKQSQHPHLRNVCRTSIGLCRESS